MRIKSLFNQAAQNYDQSRRQLIPWFDDFYGTVLDVIPFEPNQSIQVLDLGAGTGLLTALVAEAFPTASLTLIDISAEMLKRAKERFANQANRFDFQVMDLAQITVDYGYDLIISALAIHHLTDDDKQHLFQQIYQTLSPNGIFINADQALGPTPKIDNFYWQTWRRRVIEMGVSEDVLATAMERMQEDKSSPLEMQLDWLRQVGFKDVHCWYKNYAFVVYSGRNYIKPSSLD